MAALNKTIVLSSTSLQRQKLLAQLGLPFISFSPDIDETPIEGEDAYQLVHRLAEQKALAAAPHYSKAILIGSDEVGSVEGKILNKPLTHENAVAQLQQSSGRCVRFYTGLCVYDVESLQKKVIVEYYDVHFRQLSNTMIENYLKREQPYYCAGSIKAEGLAVTLIERFQGNDFSTLIGLPILQLVRLLEVFGVDWWAGHP